MRAIARTGGDGRAAGRRLAQAGGGVFVLFLLKGVAWLIVPFVVALLN